MKRTLILILLVFLLAACKTSTPAPTEPAYPSGSNMFLPIVGGSQPTATQAYPAPGGTVEPSALPISSGTVQIYLIALEDNGKSGKAVGCGDSAVPVDVMVDPAADPMRAALESLLALKEQYYGQSGLYTALYQSTLQVSNIEVTASTVMVTLTGQMMLGGECDNPRVKAQLEETVTALAGGRQIKIMINDKTLDEALSLK